jgi:hypothetical protein
MKNFFYLSFALLIFSCDSQRSTSNNQVEFANTIWKSEGVNCNSYYKFETDKYIMLNPCYSNEQKEQIELLAWKQGNFKTSANDLTLNISKTCNKNQIGKSETMKFELIGNNQLLFVNETDTTKLVKIESTPEISNTVETGYWDFKNGDKWINSPNCLPEL